MNGMIDGHLIPDPGKGQGLMEAGIGIVPARDVRLYRNPGITSFGGIKVYFRVSQLQGDDEKCELYFLEGFSDIRPTSDRGVALYTLEMGYIYRGEDVLKAGSIGWRWWKGSVNIRVQIATTFEGFVDSGGKSKNFLWI